MQNNEQIFDYLGKYKFKAFTNDKAFYPSFRDNTEYQPQIMKWARKYIGINDHVIDGGANLGLFTVQFSELCKYVHAFEPILEFYSQLIDNLLLNNCKNIYPYRNALYKEKCELNFYNAYRPKDNTNMGGSYASLEGSTIVNAQPLDAFNIPAAFIKLDIQDSEYDCLQGAGQTIRTHKPYIVIEISRKDLIRQEYAAKIVKLLSKLNYKCIDSFKKDHLYVPK